MKILLTGATGYIGKRLLPKLVDMGCDIVCGVRDKRKFHPGDSIKDRIQVIELDLIDKSTFINLPKDIDIAYYLVHSMSSSKNFEQLEKISAINFREEIHKTNVKQVIYLSGIVNAQTLSNHLNSRKNVEMELSKGKYALTTVRAGIIIGSGSASFEIIRDLVEKLPIMIAPKWLKTKCQPIGISDVIKILTGIMNNHEVFNKSFDIGGPDILTYKEMLLKFASVRGLKRYIGIVPVMTPKLSSYWLFFITSTSYNLAKSLVDSMKVEVIAQNDDLNQLLKIQPLSYTASIQQAFKKIEQNEILSSWKDSTISGRLNFKISDYINVPQFGCYQDIRKKKVVDLTSCIDKIWTIGGETGWYYANWLWNLRGVIDKFVGGVGLRRGRTNLNDIHPGDTLDFWRVIYASRTEKRLLLFAEMKLPGEAWLEFRIQDGFLVQTATFRPKGLLGRTYWYLGRPFHEIIFKGLIQELTKPNTRS
ncbi:SDR family oxidoreductase [Thermophagus sp. OGC60D27]|uniref:SDR family oxidoreductase n=1 Tax=Thermophagus sp. OGC60D27 TaxID=3458415 RepID=UPI0040381526